MIGKTIRFLSHKDPFDEQYSHIMEKWQHRDLDEPKYFQGEVVDAWTEVSGISTYSVSGASASILGIGEGKVKGSGQGKVQSRRIYLVELYPDWDKNKENPRYYPVRASSIFKIIYENDDDSETEETKEETRQAIQEAPGHGQKDRKERI